MILLLVSLFLDMILNPYFSYVPYHLSYFQPMLLVTAVIIYSYFFSTNKNSLLYLFIIGLLYDVFFGTVYLMQTVLFIGIYYGVSLFALRFHKNFFTFILTILLGLITYLFSQYIILVIVGYGGVSSGILIDRIVHSLLLNAIYGGIWYYLFGLKVRNR